MQKDASCRGDPGCVLESHTLLVVPTIELALQYQRWIRHFTGQPRHLLSLLVHSTPLEAQLASLQNLQPHILVGTPDTIMEVSARSKEIFGRKLRQFVDTVVVDEVDAVLKLRPDIIDKLYRRQRLEIPAQLPRVLMERRSKGSTLLLVGAARRIRLGPPPKNPTRWLWAADWALLEVRIGIVDGREAVPELVAISASPRVGGTLPPLVRRRPLAETRIGLDSSHEQ